MNPLQPPDSHYLRAVEGWLDLGNHIEANEELEKIAPLNRAHPDVLLARWHIYAKAQKWDACVDLGKAMVELAPERVRSWIAHAKAYTAQQRYQEAYDVLLPALSKFPKEAGAHYHLARCACQLGKLSEAVEWIEKAFQYGGNELKLKALDDIELKPLWDKIGQL